MLSHTVTHKPTAGPPPPLSLPLPCVTACWRVLSLLPSLSVLYVGHLGVLRDGLIHFLHFPQLCPCSDHYPLNYHLLLLCRHSALSFQMKDSNFFCLSNVLLELIKVAISVPVCDRDVDAQLSGLMQHLQIALAGHTHVGAVQAVHHMPAEAGCHALPMLLLTEIQVSTRLLHCNKNYTCIVCHRLVLSWIQVSTTPLHCN